jgi:hypothetical protein
MVFPKSLAACMVASIGYSHQNYVINVNCSIVVQINVNIRIYKWIPVSIIFVNNVRVVTNSIAITVCASVVALIVSFITIIPNVR